jgi:hypothetical protein
MDLINYDIIYFQKKRSGLFKCLKTQTLSISYYSLKKKRSTNGENDISLKYDLHFRIDI